MLTKYQDEKDEHAHLELHANMHDDSSYSDKPSVTTFDSYVDADEEISSSNEKLFADFKRTNFRKRNGKCEVVDF